MQLDVAEAARGHQHAGARLHFDIAVPDGPLGRAAVFGSPLRQVRAVEQHDRILWRGCRGTLRSWVHDGWTRTVHRMLRPLLCGHRSGENSPEDKDCEFRIEDCGFDVWSFNPQSAIDNLQWIHGFQVPFATAGTNVSTPGPGKSSVFPCSALM